MPVLIVEDGGTTSIPKGTIQIGDLQSMSDDYINQVALTAIPPRNVIVKRYSFYFTKTQLIDLFDHFKNRPEADAIEIALGIQVPGSIVSCVDNDAGADPEGTLGAIQIDNSNCLGIIISMANRDSLTKFNEVDDCVLINGYRPNAAFSAEQCCPGSKPPPPSS